MFKSIKHIKVYHDRPTCIGKIKECFESLHKFVLAYIFFNLKLSKLFPTFFSVTQKGEFSKWMTVLLLLIKIVTETVNLKMCLW